MIRWIILQLKGDYAIMKADIYKWVESFLSLLNYIKVREMLSVNQNQIKLDNLIFCSCHLFVMSITEILINMKPQYKGISHMWIKET